MATDYRQFGGVKKSVLQGGEEGKVAWNFGVLRIGASDRVPEYRWYNSLKDAGAGKTVLLYEAARKVLGRDLDPGPQKIGDCVSWGWSGAVDLTACIQIALGNLPEEFTYEMRTCTEAMYALSRVEYGNLDGSYEDGSVGEWAAEAASKGGTLSRKRLGAYDPQRAKQWGAKGLPDEYESEAKLHLIKTVALVTSWEDARDLLASGHPIAVCSNVGFEGRRDSQGFIKRRGNWGHCMKWVGVRDDGRPGPLNANSWDFDHADEPKGEHDIPGNCWWIDADTADAMLKQRDSFALSAFVGYPSQNISWVF